MRDDARTPLLTAGVSHVDFEATHYETSSNRQRGDTPSPTSIVDRQTSACVVGDGGRELPFLEALVKYLPAIAWAAFFSIGVVMAAFDSQLIGNLYATPAFQRDFGYKYKDRFIIPAPWQTGLSMGSPLGQVFGSFLATYPMERFGRKTTFGVCVILTAGCVFIQFSAQSLAVLLIGELLGGLVLGCYVVISPAYASEICPVDLRGILTSATNIAFVAGQLLANGVIAGTSRLSSHWAYSLPFAVQWIWPAIILPILVFAPESPWWLLRKGRTDDARKSLKRLASADVDVQPALAMIIETDLLERKIEAGSTYADCFKIINLRRTEIATGVYCIQVLSGIYLVSYATYFFQLAGLPIEQSFNMGIGFLALGFIGTILSWVIVTRVGRRRIYITGLALLATLQLAIGILDCVPNYDLHTGVTWAQASLMLVWNFVYGCSLGPVCFIILCEVSATRVRSKTIGIATVAQACLGIAMAVAIPYMINPDQGDLRGKLGFVFGGLATVCWIWAYARIPETGGRTYEELDIMFERKVPAREFKSYVIT